MSGRYKTLETEHGFPDGEWWLEQQATEYSRENAKQKRIALEQFDRFLSFVEDRDQGPDEYTVHDVDNDALKDFSRYLDSRENLAQSTIPRRFYAVRSYLNDHIDPDLGYLDDDDKFILDWVDGGTETVRQQHTDIHWLEIEKINQLIEGAKNLKNRLVIELLWNTGCRPSEIARMKKERHEPDNRSVKVKTSKVQDTDATNYERTVFYSRSMRSTMREWLDYGGRESHPHADDSPYLIVGYNTPSISARQINKIVRMAAEEAGIQEDMIETAGRTKDGDKIIVNRLTPKCLRHSFAVHSVRGKEKSGTPPMDLERLRRLLGHRSLDVTRKYLRYRQSDLKDAYDRSHPA